KFLESQEKPGYVYGFAENTGDALTYKIIKPNMKTVISRSVIQPATDISKRNRHVKFDEDTKEKLKKEEADRNPGTTDNPICIPDDFKDDDEEDEEEDKEKESKAVSMRTQSKAKHFKREESNFVILHVKTQGDTNILTSSISRPMNMIRNILFFMLLPVLMWIPETDAAVPEIGEKFYQNTIEDFEPHKWDQLRYLHALDKAESSGDEVQHAGNDIMEGNTDIWNIGEVIDHRVKGGRHEVKCKFKGQPRSTSWLDMYSLALQDPIPILKYAKRKHLLSQAPFSNLSRYCVGDAPSRLAQVFKAKIRPGSKKFQFRVEVPMGIKYAFHLDKSNGNTLWLDAIKTELKQINDYETFGVLDEGESAPKGY
ncbi:MAG: hypothetical protein AAF587_44960, partial [Bacteroidota bacterium]